MRIKCSRTSWLGDSTDGIAGEFLTVLHLKKGFQTLGVNSDDGFRATVGLNFHDMEAQQIGLFDGGRGAADSLLNIVVPEEGYYPLRVLWWEGGGGANIEIFSIVDGEKVLVNDPDNADAIKAYNIGNSTGRTYFGSVSPRRTTHSPLRTVSLQPSLRTAQRPSPGASRSC